MAQPAGHYGEYAKAASHSLETVASLSLVLDLL
eukprot:CAMPEP_0179411948 /NCGR_PEP_ID=MMETSP0799-20121207/4184_1 /TAXON_ID=46947 /ORGANISM="Geminigera cryophila, Strain CCMP2564" /LENGTH=32 /DNA_ID= /DNA_START= /DNA_END= /DNA_ORIENTATION=